MTREEFRGALSDIDEGSRLSHSEEARKAEILLLDHDKEQRAEIDRQAQAIRNLETDYILIGTQNREQKDKIARLREALKTIYALVMGECPALLNEDSGGDAALCLEIENILKETP